MKKLLLAIFLLAMASAYFARHLSQAPTPAPESESPSETDSAPPTPKPTDPSALEQAGITVPSLDQVADEIRENPHSTPASLLEFATNLGARMSVARNSKPEAQRLFGELENCVANPAIPSAQAMCLNDARRLSARYESLEGRYQNLLTNATPEAARLLRFIAME